MVRPQPDAMINTANAANKTILFFILMLCKILYYLIFR